MANLSVELTADIKRLESELTRAKRELASLEGVASKTNTKTQRSFNKLGKGVSNTTPTILEFNRVIQDAPFGIQGVANNITQLTQNFGHLRTQAGGTRAALKLLVGSLAGPAGILFAISTITSLLVSFGDELFSSSKKAEKLQETIDGINETFASELKLSKAIEESLTLQGKSTIGILGSRKNLLNTQLSGLANLIEEQKQLLAIQKLENARVDNLEVITGFFGKLFKQAKGIVGAINTLAFETLLTDAEKLLGIEIDRSKFASASAEDKEKERKLQVQLNNLLAQQREIQNDILKINKEVESSVRSSLTTIQTGLSQGLAQTGQGNGLVAPILNSLDQLPEKFRNVTGVVLDISQSLAQGLSNGFAAIGQTIAQGGNIIDAVGRGILQTMGSIAVQLGQATIAAGVAGLALKNLFKSPVAAIAAGGVLVAIGSALSAASGAVQNIGSGNIGGQGSSSFSGSNTSSFSNSGFGGGRVVFEISGRKLIGVLNNNLSANERLGGNISVG